MHTYPYHCLVWVYECVLLSCRCNVPLKNKKKQNFLWCYQSFLVIASNAKRVLVPGDGGAPASNLPQDTTRAVPLLATCCWSAPLVWVLSARGVRHWARTLSEKHLWPFHHQQHFSSELWSQARAWVTALIWHHRTPVRNSAWVAQVLPHLPHQSPAWTALGMRAWCSLGITSDVVLPNLDCPGCRELRAVWVSSVLEPVAGAVIRDGSLGCLLRREVVCHQRMRPGGPPQGRQWSLLGQHPHLISLLGTAQCILSCVH